MKTDMEQNAQITLVEIRERLVRIETILEEQDFAEDGRRSLFYGAKE